MSRPYKALLGIGIGATVVILGLALMRGPLSSPHDCGTITVADGLRDDTPAVASGSDGAPTCFSDAAVHCNSADLTFRYTGTDYVTTYKFQTRPTGIVGCTLKDSITTLGNFSHEKTQTEDCRDTAIVNGDLHVRNCGSSKDDIIVPASGHPFAGL